LESFNPDDILKDIKKQMNSMEDLTSDEQIYPDPIIIPKMTTDAVTENVFCFPMSNFFTAMAPYINYNPTTVTVAQNQAPFNFFNTALIDPAAPPFDAVFVHEGEIKISLDFGASTPPPSVTLNGVKITGPTYFDSPVIKTMVLNSTNNYSDTIDISNAKIEIAPSLQVLIDSIDNPTSVPFDIQIKVVQPITLRGAVNLRIGSATDSLPPEIIEDFELAPVPDMINAKIAEGRFNITTEPPLNTGSPGTTYSEDLNMNIGYTIHMKQDPVGGPNYPSDGLNGLNGEELTETNNLLNDKWINGNSVTVDDEENNTISITASSTSGITFELFDDDVYDDNGTPKSPFTDKILPVKVSMGMDVRELQVVRWKTENDHGERILPQINVPPINFAGANGTDAVYIKSITFNKMDLNVNFIVPVDEPPVPHGNQTQLTGGDSGLPPELKNHIALKINCDDLGFNESKVLATEENKFKGSTPNKMIVDPSDPTIIVYADLLPVVGGQVKDADFPYMEFGPVIMGDDDIKMNIYAEVDLDYEWSDAEIDLQAAMRRSDRDIPQGTFPENIQDDAIDLSDIGKYMHGISFGGGIAAKIFLGGPTELIDIMQPQLFFSAEWEDENDENQEPQLQEEIMINREAIKVEEALPQLPVVKNSNGEWVYSGLDLPLPDHGLVLTGSFNKIFSSYPTKLYFRYEMILPGADNPVTVHPKTFNNVEEGNDSKIKALLVLLMPLEFLAEPGGYIALPSDLFRGGDEEEGSEEENKEESDLFGRKNVGDDSAFTNVNIKSLGINIDFDNTLFRGSYLHFDRDDLLFGPGGFNVGNGNSLNFVFTGEQQKVINENLIYPDIKFVFPQAETLKVSKYCLPLRIVVAASGSYTMDFEDIENLFGSGN